MDWDIREAAAYEHMTIPDLAQRVLAARAAASEFLALPPRVPAGQVVADGAET